MNTKQLLICGAAVAAVGAYAWLGFDRGSSETTIQTKGRALNYRASKSVGERRVEKAIKVKNNPAAKSVAKDNYDGWGADPFSEKPSFDFDEELDAQMNDELKSILADLNTAFSQFDPNRKTVYTAAQRLLAAIAAGRYDVPRFAKLKAIDALKWLGTTGVPEMIGMLTDADGVVVQEAKDALMEQLVDFDTNEAQLLAIVEQLVKVPLSDANYESILFAISSFSNANKVRASLAICDTGTEGALAALQKNVDFVFDEAEAESIQTREDIVQYGKDHPDTQTDFDLEKK